MKQSLVQLTETSFEVNSKGVVTERNPKGVPSQYSSCIVYMFVCMIYIYIYIFCVHFLQILDLYALWCIMHLSLALNFLRGGQWIVFVYWIYCTIRLFQGFSSGSPSTRMIQSHMGRFPFESPVTGGNDPTQWYDIPEERMMYFSDTNNKSKLPIWLVIITLPETKIALENRPSQKEMNHPTIDFPVLP